MKKCLTWRRTRIPNEMNGSDSGAGRRGSSGRSNNYVLLRVSHLAPPEKKNWPPPRPWWNFPHNNWPGSANGSLHFVCCCSDLSLSFSSQLRWFYPAKVQLQFDFWNRIQFPIEWRVAGGDLLEQNPLWVDHDHDHPPLIMLLVMRRITRWWLHIFVEIEPNPQYKCWLLRKDINTSPYLVVRK